MKEKLKRISKSSWALILAVMMLVSSFSVLAATTNTEQSKASGTVTVYFKDTVGWNDAYVYFYNSSYWSDSNGSGSNGIAGGPYKMTKVDGTDDVYSYTYTGNYSQYISFTKVSQANYGNFWSNEAVYRTDFSTDKTMYTPNTTSSGTYNSNVKYYNNGTWSTYGGTTTGHTVYIYGNCNTNCNKWEKFDVAPATPTLEYDEENNKYYLNNFSMEFSTCYFRFYDKNTGTHYMGTGGDTTALTSGVSSGMKKYTTWSTTNYRFSYPGATDKKVNIEVAGDFSKVTVTDVNTKVADSVSLTSNATDGKIYYGTDLELTATLTNKNSSVSSVNYTFTDDKDSKTEKVTSDSDTGSATFSGLSEGTHKIKVEASADGYDTVSDEITVTVEKQSVVDSLTLSADSDTKIVGDPVKLTANATGAKADLTYTFNRVDADGKVLEQLYSGTNDNYTVENLVKGTFYYNVTVSADNYTDVTSTTQSVTVSQAKIGDKVELTADPAYVNKGGSTKLTANVTNPASGTLVFTFKNGDTVIDTVESTNGSASTTVTDLTADSYTYDVVVTMKGDTIDKYETISATTTVAVTTPDVGTSVTLTANPSTVNADEESTLTAVLKDKIDGRAVTYTFYKVENGNRTKVGEVADTTESNATCTVSNSEEGTYNYIVEVSAANCNSKVSEQATVTVKIPDVATSVSLKADNTTIYTDDTLTLTANAEGQVEGDLEYTFSDGTNTKTETSSTGEVSTTFTGLSKGDHNFTVTVKKTGYKDVVSSTVKVTVKAVPTNNYYICGTLVGDSTWGASYKDHPLEYSKEKGYWVSKDLFSATGKNQYFRLNNGSGTAYGPVDGQYTTDIEIKNTHTVQLTTYHASTKAYYVASTVTKSFRICTDGTYVWYDTISPVAESVALTADSDEKYVGDSLTLTADLTTPVTSDVTYKFVEVAEDGTETVLTSTGNTATVDNLTEGSHSYKVTVSADGYDSVTATMTITVNKHNVADSVSLSATPETIDYGNTSTLTAVLTNKYDGEVTYTFEDVTSGEDNPTTLQTVKTAQANAALVLDNSVLTPGEHKFRVTASADGYISKTSDIITITVNEVAVTDKVTLTGVDEGATYYVGNSVTLKANCTAPEGVTVNYNYYVNGKKINNTPTPNRVTYDFSASDKGDITFYAEAVADNYTSVKSDEISATVDMKKIADKVVLTATPNPVKERNDLTITAKLDGNVQSGDFTYTFSETTANGDIQSVTSKDGSAMIVTNSLSVGKHEIKVVVSGTNFESIQATTTVEVKAEYTSEDVNKTSGKTILISYDSKNASNSNNVQNYVHAWKNGTKTAVVDGTTSAGEMTALTSIAGLYYKDLSSYDSTFGDSKISFLVKHGTGWSTGQSDDVNDNFTVGKQWYHYNASTVKHGEYTPLTLSSIKVPTEIYDDDSTNFELSLTGGTPYFFGKTVGKANDNAVYTVTITDSNGKEVATKTFTYSAETTVAKLEGLTLTDSGKYTFTITDGIDTVSYEKDLTVEPLVVDNYKATVNASDNATITVTCKGTTITGGNTGELPEKKNATINVTDIKDGYKIKSVSVKSGVTEIPITRQQYGTYIFTMPSSDVTITVDVVEKSKYQVNYGVSDKTNGSITAVAGSDTVKTGSRIVEGTEVTFTATVTNSADYKIDGWYSDSSYKNKIADVADDATTYTTTVSDTTNVYVKISENPGKLCTDRWLIYGTNDNPTTWTNRLDVYSKADGSYYVNFDISTLGKGNYYYALTSKKTGTLSASSEIWWQDSKDKVTFSTTDSSIVKNQIKESYYAGDVQYKNYGMFSVADATHLTGLTLKITPLASGQGGTYLMMPTVKTAPEGSIEVYAKDGTLLTTSGYGDTTVTGMNADCAEFVEEHSNYNLYAAMTGDRLTVTTVVNDDNADDGWYVSNYVINGYGYDAIETVTRAASTGKSYTISTPYSVKSTDTKLEITPIYKNKNIEAADDYITLYANADSLGDRWGNTISVYSYYYEGGSVSGTTKYMNSAYPGEPMMRQSNGLFVAYVPKNAWGDVNGKFQKLDNYAVSGITFNNYKENETIHQKFLTSDQNKNYQTYDYDDFKYIAAAGYDTVLYDFEYRKADSSNQKTLVNNATKAPDKTGTTIDVDTYADTTAHNGWDVLTNMDNEEVSLLGYTARVASTLGETFDSTNKLHIVSVGNINTTMGKWSTIWYVYDKDGNYVTQGLPSDFIPRYDTNADGSVSETESETQTDAYYAIKAAGYAYTGAYITYENEMDAGTSTETLNSGIRSDGRWYYSRAAEQVKVNTHVLYADASTSTSWTEDSYGADFAGTFTGAKALVGTERSTTVDRNTDVSITATALGQGTADVQYKFIGWTTDATKGTDGKFTVVQNPSMTDSSQTVKVSSNMDLYALYIPIAEGDLVISHEKYTGENAYGGPGRYFVQAVLYDEDGNEVETYYQEGSVTIPNYTENSGKIEVQLIVYSVNGSRYKETYNYQFNKITDQTHVDKVCSSNNPAVVERTIKASDIFADGKMKTNKVDFYSDLQTNNITVKMNYYNRKIENGKPADLDSTPTSYSYRFTSYPSEVLDDSGNLSIPLLIEYAKNRTQTPDSMIEKYISWNSQADALAGITSYYNYHTGAYYESTPYHTDKYGNVQSSGEKWVTYYDRNGVEVSESEASAETVSSISIWFFNTPKKYTYTMNTASTSDNLVQNGNIYYGNDTQTVSNLFYNTRLFASDKTISDASSDYTQGYGVDKGYTTDKVTTADTIENGGTTLKFLYWAYDTAGKNVASTNIEYGLRITNDTKLYAIYGETELKAPGLTVSEVAPDTFFDSNNISKTRINTLFNPYNCKDNDENINDVAVVYLRVANQSTAKSINNMTEEELLNLRKQISTVVSKAQYEKFKSGEVDSDASAAIVQITGSTASGFKFKVVDQVSEGATELQTSLSNKNRGQFTTTFTTSTLRNYTYYVFATMGYKNYNGDDSSVVTKNIDGDDVSYITSTNFVKYSFDENGKYTG